MSGTIGAGVKLDCGHVLTKQPADGIGTGYARDRDGATLCYSCADSASAAELTTADSVVQYVSEDGKNITTWTGGVLMRIRATSAWRGGWNHSLIHSWTAVDASGQHWHGRNAGPGMAITMWRSTGLPR